MVSSINLSVQFVHVAMGFWIWRILVAGEAPLCDEIEIKELDELVDAERG